MFFFPRKESYIGVVEVFCVFLIVKDIEDVVSNILTHNLLVSHYNLPIISPKNSNSMQTYQMVFVYCQSNISPQHKNDNVNI